MELGFHTDAFNSSYWNFDQCLEWGHARGIPFIECGTIDGVSWIHGLGYQPHIALWEDPLQMRRKMDRLDIRFSQLDAAFPLSRPEGVTLGVEYVLHTMRWAHVAGCPRVDTTDDRFSPSGMTEGQCLEQMRKIYRHVCAIGEGVNAENIRKCVDLLTATGYAGVLSLECEGQGGPMIERSLAWVRGLLAAGGEGSARS